jgi:aspartokinase
VNVIAIAQGSSEYNISLVVQESCMQRSLAALHKEFQLHEGVSAVGETSSVAIRS